VRCEEKQNEYCGEGWRIGNGDSPLNSCGDLFDQEHLLARIDLLQFYLDDFILRSLDCASDKRSFDGQLAVSAIDEHEQLHAARASMVEEGIERGANGAARVENVVDEDDVFVSDIETDVHFVHYRFRTGGR